MLIKIFKNILNKKFFFTVILMLLLKSFCFANGIDISKYDYNELDKSKIVFGDGDTIIYDSTTIRILGIDTPEVKNEAYGLMENQYLGKEASAFTRKAITNAKNVYCITYKKDYYGRTLAHIILDDELLGVMLIHAGLAYEDISVYGDNGFREFGDRIIKAWKETSKPNFMNPRIWRRKYQKRQKSPHIIN
jgi:endonuclease YncB( thermonuclease family)